VNESSDFRLRNIPLNNGSGYMPALGTKFTSTTTSVIIPSQASESSGEAIYRSCGVII
jgi:hypothetical protein